MSASFLYSLTVTAAASHFFLVGATASGAQLSIIGISATTGNNSVSRITENCQISDSWLARQTTFATDVEVLGGFVYLAEFDGAIQKYSLNGTFSRHFPNLSFRAGSDTHNQMLGADAAGNIYSAFSGTSSLSRKSFRLSADGVILSTYHHSSLVFPGGIDAARSGDVYIANGSRRGAGFKVYRFTDAGEFIASYPLFEPQDISALEIDEARNRMYISGSLTESIYAYDISTGKPIFTGELKALPSIHGITVEPTTGRLFGTYGGDIVEIALDSSGVTTFATNAAAYRSIGAITIPEPTSITMAILLFIALCSTQRIRYGLR